MSLAGDAVWKDGRTFRKELAGGKGISLEVVGGHQSLAPLSVLSLCSLSEDSVTTGFLLPGRPS